MKRLFALCASALALMLPGTIKASSIVGGDALTQASATSILDIVFAIDTSASMSDDIATIGNLAQTVIRNLECPDCDVWIRARFGGINGVSGTVFNENLRSVIVAGGAPAPITNHLEDNGPIVNDIINHSSLFFNNDAVAGQNYYKAIVTIGDEGTEDGSSVTQADWNAAIAANQAAIANNVLLFSWVTDDPFAGVPAVFKAMSEGGAVAAGFTGGPLGATGGKYFQTVNDTTVIRTTLEEILCEAGSGGTGVPDGGNSALLILAGLVSLRFLRRR